MIPATAMRAAGTQLSALAFNLDRVSAIEVLEDQAIAAYVLQVTVPLHTQEAIVQKLIADGGTSAWTDVRRELDWVDVTCRWCVVRVAVPSDVMEAEL